MVGIVDGVLVGALEGNVEGKNDTVGTFDGTSDGNADGNMDVVGTVDGMSEGKFDGADEGNASTSGRKEKQMLLVENCRTKTQRCRKLSAPSSHRGCHVLPPRRTKLHKNARQNLLAVWHTTPVMLFDFASFLPTHGMVPYVLRRTQKR